VRKLQVIALGLVLAFGGAAYLATSAYTSQKDTAKSCCADCCCCKAEAGGMCKHEKK
jgi:hypothetical protein